MSGRAASSQKNRGASSSRGRRENDLSSSSFRILTTTSSKSTEVFGKSHDPQPFFFDKRRQHIPHACRYGKTGPEVIDKPGTKGKVPFRIRAIRTESDIGLQKEVLPVAERYPFLDEKVVLSQQSRVSRWSFVIRGDFRVRNQAAGMTSGELAITCIVANPGGCGQRVHRLTTITSIPAPGSTSDSIDSTHPRVSAALLQGDFYGNLARAPVAQRISRFPISNCASRST